MMKELFVFLCGILYLIGYPFGLTYEDTSIYVCIYLWPILCCISTFPILIVSIIHLNKIKGILFSILSFIYSSYYIYYTNLVIDRYSINNKNSFMNCMLDLKIVSERIGISYEELNILIYVFLFGGIILFNFILYKIVKFILNKF